MKYILIILFIIAPFAAISLTLTSLYYNTMMSALKRFKTRLGHSPNPIPDTTIFGRKTIFDRHQTAFKQY